MLQIDLRLTDAQVAQFAAQTEALPPTIRNFMHESFSGAESPEFYHGLSAGLAAAYQIAQLERGRDYIGAALATATQQILCNE